MTEKILVIDDDPWLHEILGLFLEAEGYQVYSAYGGSEGLSMLNSVDPDLIILDLHMPDTDGTELCRQIRLSYHQPILFLSGDTNTDAMLKSLQSGGNDYIVKPFRSDEIKARIKSNLRWGMQLAAARKSGHTLTFPGMQIDLDRVTVSVNGHAVELTAKEMQLLIALASRPRTVLHAERLYVQVWGNSVYYSPDTVKTHIYHLRKAIETRSEGRKYIHTVKGFGYKFDANLS
ncbi:response regulator transcription factor [Cohnella suwonensis]|uniref:Response regulator transcription factor n=1 Tax=Cohnella suwonensis TaxID=696072 RepID=A0ABW0M3M2_9BACL